MSAAAVLCACGECRALDIEFPNDGHQLALITAAQDRSSAMPPMQSADDATPRRANALSRRGATSLPNLPTKENLPRRSPMFKTMTIGELCVSPYNVRTNEVDANAIAGMAESLLTRGQLYPLVVHPMPAKPGKKKTYGALAGGRRYRAFSLLVTQGKLPASHPIDVIVRDITDEGELRELSLAENLVRVELRPYEVYAAVARAHVTRSLKDIADTNGQTVETVRQWARLGNLHPTVFAALEAGQIGTKHAMAFGATDDQDLQLHAFDQFMQRSDRGGDHAPGVIRRLLKVGDSELTKLLHFVGEKAYRDAGGRYELDLFADQAEERGRVCDEGLLLQMVEAKLESARALIRQQVSNHTSDRKLRFKASPPKEGNFGGWAQDLEISTEAADVHPDDAERSAFVQNEMAELEKRAELLLSDPALSQEEKDAAIAAIDVDYEPLEHELAQIDSRRTLALPEGDIFATLEIEQDGTLETRFWWASRKAKRDAEKPAASARAPLTRPIPKVEAEAAVRAIMPKPGRGGVAIDSSYGFGERQKADFAIKDEHGLTADGVQVLRSLRREVLRCSLLDDAENDGTYGRDYATWSLLRFELAGGYGHELGARRLAGGYETNYGSWQVVQPHLKRSLAGMRWTKEGEQLRAHASMSEQDLAAAFRAYLEETELWKTKAGAYLAGLMLERSLNAPGYQVPLHDLLAAGVRLNDATLRGYVEPTEELVELLPKAQRLALAKPHVDKMAFGTWGKMKAGELTAPVTRALRKARNWVHPLMQFAPPPKPALAEMKEAAE